MCNSCGKSNFVMPTPSQAMHGVVGNAKIVLGLDEAPIELQRQRWDVCRECPDRTSNQKYINDPKIKGLTKWTQCKVCACPIGRKTMLKSEKCPKGKW